MMNNKLSTSILLAAAIAFVQVPFSSDAYAYEAKKEVKKKKRKSQLVSPHIGKKVNRAFELYDKDDIPGALVLLLDISINDDKVFDKAYVSRFIAIMYATLGDHEKDAIKYLKLAVGPDILNTGEHGESLKLLADLQLQTGQYRDALKNYYAWMDFTGKSTGEIWSRVANSHYALKELDKVIEPCDNAIRDYGNKQNKNPYILKLTAYYEQKKYKEAVDVLETAVQLFPDEDTFWNQLGTFYVLVEDYKKALSTLDLSYKLGYVTKQNQVKTLASLYSQHDMPYKAAILLEKFTKTGLLPKDESNYTRLAGAWQSAMHIDKAAKYYGELAKLSNKAKHYNQQGMLLKQDEQFSKAIVALNKALELGYKNKGAIHMAIAESYFYLEKYKQAYAAVKKAAKDPKTKRVAKGWTGFIKDKAKRKNISI